MQLSGRSFCTFICQGMTVEKGAMLFSVKILIVKWTKGLIWKIFVDQGLTLDTLKVRDFWPIV